MECLTYKVKEFKGNRRNKYVINIYSCTHGFQKVKEHRTNFVMAGKADVHVDSHSRHHIFVKY
jgi:hypothetical protein